VAVSALNINLRPGHNFGLKSGVPIQGRRIWKWEGYPLPIQVGDVGSIVSSSSRVLSRELPWPKTVLV